MTTFRILFLVVSSLLLSVTAHGECSRVFSTTGLQETDPDELTIPNLRNVMKKAGCPLRVVPMNSSHQRRFRLIETGELDVIGEASMLPEREQYAWFSKAYRYETTLLIGLRNNSALSSIHHVNDIAPQKLHVLVPEGGWFGADVERERERWRAKSLLISYKDPLSSLRDLRKGRAQLMVATDALLKTVFEKENDLIVLPVIVHTEPVYFMFSKKSVSEREVQFINQFIQTPKQTSVHLPQ